MNKVEQMLRRAIAKFLLSIPIAVLLSSVMLLIAAAIALFGRGSYQAWPWPAFSLLFSVSVLALGAVGALVATRRPGNALGWLLSCMGLAAALASAARIYVVRGLGPNLELVAASLRISNDALVVAFVAFLLLFPNGRLPSPAWRILAWLIGISLGQDMVKGALMPGTFEDPPGINNPFGVSGPMYDLLQSIPTPPIPLVVVALGVAAASVLIRMKRSRGVEHQQLKWLSFAGVLPISAVGVMLLVDWYAGYLMLVCSMVTVAAAVGIAILRYRLLDIDVIINRTLVYSSVTAMLAGLFAALSIVTQRLVLAVTGQESEAAVVLAALVVTALFQPLRARVQTVMDRRFYRHKYDATRTLERFASQIRDQVELELLTAGLVAVVQDTMQPKQVFLWLRPTVVEVASHIREEDR